MESEPSAPRPRGRRRTPRADQADTRALILVAATAEFASRGYDAASMRAIARAAGVDPALVHHYFADKADLFTESLGAPIRPDRIVLAVLRGPRELVGETIVRTLLGTLDEGHNSARIVGLLRTALGHEFAATVLRQFLVREVLARVATELGGDDGELRATLAASQLVGLIVVRYGVRIEPLASASVDQLVERIGPVVQWHLTRDPLPRS